MESFAKRTPSSSPSSEEQSSSTTTNQKKKQRTFEPRYISFRQQFSALVIRNVTIKKRQYIKTLMQLLFPLFILSNMFFQKPDFVIVKQIDDPIIDSKLYAPPYLSFYQTWYFINNNVFDQEGMKKFLNTIDRIAPILFQTKIYYNTTFRTYEQFEKFHLQQSLQENFLLISFDSYKNRTIEYTIRMEKRFIPVMPLGGVGDCEDNGIMAKPTCDPYKFFTYGFCTIQAIMDTAIIKFMDRGYISNIVPNFNIGIFPQPLSFSMSKYHMKMVISFITLSFMPFFSIVPVSLVQEKEKRIKEAMHLMGMKTLPYWLSWAFVEIMLSIIPCLLTTFVFVLFELTIFMNPLYFYIMLQLYSLSLILIGFLVSVPFQTTKVASIASSLTGFSIPWLFYGLELMSISMEMEKYMAIFSPLAFAYTIKYSMLTIEHIPWYSLTEYSLGFGMIMIIIDIILYTVLLILTDIFLTNRETFINTIIRLFKTPVKSDKLKELQRKRRPKIVDIETVDDDLQDDILIRVRNVSKIYDKFSIAVNDLSMDIYESQITALLGQNGAGKTTLINMIIGSMQPSFGQVTVCDLKVDNIFHVADLRTRFGICFQEDIIFDELTPLEHLKFFGRIKGASGRQLDQEIRFLLAQTDLTAKMHHTAGVLSGGQKRKLCTAIALVGGSQIIMLDEPTSGVDPYSREKLWSLLRSYKKNRVIMLSTHTMYEADVLADRKAIVVKGAIRCCGSSMFLKNKFGVGYHLRLEIEPKTVDIKNVENIMSNHIHGSKLVRQTQDELLFTLPKNETFKFPTLFESIDKIIDTNQGILGYGIKLTTLEDVFLKICYESDEILQEQINQTTSTTNLNVFDFNELNKIKFKQNSFLVMWYLFDVKMKVILRNWQFLISITIQALVIVFFMLFTSTRLIEQMPQRIVLESNQYPDQSIVYSGPNIKNELKLLSNSFRPIIHVDSMILTNLLGKHYAITYNHTTDNNKENEFDFTLLFNKSYQYALPILQNAMTNMLLQSGNLNSDSKEHLNRIRTASYPLPDRSNSLEDGLDMLFIVMFGMSLTQFPVNLAAETIKERDDNVKSYLNINGMKILQYWLVTTMVDSITFGIFVFTIIVSTYFFVPLSIYVNTFAFICAMILLILYIPCSIMTCYVFSHLFNKREVAQALMSNVSSLIAGFMYIMSYVIRVIFKSNVSYRINYFIWPFYIPFGAMQSLVYVTREQKLEDFPSFGPYFYWNNNVLPAYVAMIVHFLIGMILLPYLDHMKQERRSFKSIICCQKRKDPSDEPSIETNPEEDLQMDEDVFEEKLRVKQILRSKFKNDKPLLVIRNLTKEYPTQTAVKRLNLTMESGQIFGLLGPNGAGKTTVMKIIVRDELETSGKLYLEAVKFKDRLPPNLLAYCPQVNPFWPDITLIEHLYLYASIRGVPGNQMKEICDKLIKAFGITEYKNRKFRKLSGGNKRKLCLLISILADVKLTMLDEPSTGMDPSSKRLMWNLIIKKFDPNGPNSAMLTSHSMEEIEALCTRLAIMAKGSLKCLGNIQHLNNKYGKGYFLEIKWKKGFDFGRIQQEIISIFPDMRINEQNPELIKLIIPQNNVKSLGDFFHTMEKLSNDNPEIEEYSLNQSSIEQLFIEFAKIHEYINL